MKAATLPVQRPRDARLLVVDADGRLAAHERADLPELLAAGDLVVANDAATLPASLSGRHLPSGATIELRFAGDAAAVHAGIARHGRPVQYAHLAQPLALWDVWTRIAGPPVAFEPPSAGFVLDWQFLDALRRRGIGFATLTHAAGLSSTGDPVLDARLPFDEPYRLPASTVVAIEAAKARGGRIVAIGTTVARALEHAAARPGGLGAGSGLATNRLGRTSRLRVVDVLVSGTHEPGTSHHELLRAFVGERTLARIDAALEQGAWRTHEFGDSVWIERERAQPRWNLNTATLARRFGQVRTTLPA
ncbi:MAG TPA: S-adenosylmethionine:tRNA ribosyltransferase-isomerase [Caldimonas sp.]